MKRRLIDANALIEAISKKFQEHYGNTVYQFIHDFFRFVLKQIRKAPTIDAVEVVRCKDCKHRGSSVDCPMKYEEDCTYTDDDGYSEWYWIEHDLTCDDGFCDRGERKDGDDL